MSDIEFEFGSGNVFADLGLPDAENLLEEARKKAMHERLEQAIAEYEKKPPLERWQALIDRGAINEEGEVLLKSPLTEEDK